MDALLVVVSRHMTLIPALTVAALALLVWLDGACGR